MFKVFTSLILLFSQTFVSAEMKTVESIQEVKGIVDEALKSFDPSEIMIVFDIDHTLTQPDHPACYYSVIEKYRKVYKSLIKDLTPVQKDAMISLMVQTTPQTLIEKETPSVINGFQDKGVKVMALTATLAGKVLGASDKLVFMRRDALQKMGIDFSREGFFKGRVISNLGEEYAGGVPTFYHGFMASNGEGKNNKGEAFVNLLKVLGSTKAGSYGTGYVPKCVIFVDDRDKNVEDMETSIKNFKVGEIEPHIIFIGIKFTGARKLIPGKEISEEEFKSFWDKLMRDPRVQSMSS